MRGTCLSILHLILFLAFGCHAFAQSAPNQGMQLIPGDWMEIPDNATIELPVFTAECWIKLQSGGLIVTRDKWTGAPSDWQLWCDYSRKRFAFITAKNPPDEYFFTPDNSIVPNVWYHIALTANGPLGRANLYLNGKLILSPTFSSRDFSAETGLAWGGYFGNKSGAYLNAIIDEARYWNYERSEQQINSFMNIRVPLSERQGLMGYWMFCGNYADSSGNRNHGLRRGNPSIIDINDLPAELSCGTQKYPPSPFIVALGPTRFCAGDSVTLDAGAGFRSYLWSSGETTRLITVRQSGTYTVTVTDSSGLSGTSPPIVVVVNQVKQPVISRLGDTFISSPAASYQWYLDDNPIPGATSQLYVVTQPGNYFVMIIDSNGCRALSSVIIISPKPVTTMIGLGCTDSLFYDPGEIISLRLQLVTSENIAFSGIQTFKAFLRFLKNVLQPVPNSGISFVDEGRERTLTVTGRRDNASTQGILTDIKMIVMLGDTICTRVHLDSLMWIEGQAIVTLENQDCEICVRTCNEGGTRLFLSNTKYALTQNRPNPFNAQTTIEYEIVEDGFTQLYVVDMLGRKISSLVEGELRQGRYTASFDASQFPSGVYFYVLQTPTRVLCRQMQVLK